MEDLSELVTLNSFTDAFEADQACQLLEQQMIPFSIEDHTAQPQGTDQFQEGPLVRLDVLVARSDFEAAKVCLHDKMGLFPERETDDREPDDASDDDDVPSSAIVCDLVKDAEAARDVLSDAGIQSTVRRVVDEEDGSVSYSADVGGKDIERAAALMDKWAAAK